MADPETVRRLALQMEDVEERPSYGTPAYFTRKRLFARIVDDQTLVIKVAKDQREVMMRADADKFFVTDHYRNYPMMLVRLAEVNEDEIAELLVEAREFADTGEKA